LVLPAWLKSATVADSWSELMDIRQLQRRFADYSGPTLSFSLIVIGIALILVAIFIKNRWIKAGILAYEVLP
jgi:uncharacterized protein involved in exopolysaccharide biosynthesis